MNKLLKYLLLVIFTGLICCNKQSTTDQGLNKTPTIEKATPGKDVSIEEHWFEAKKIDPEDQTIVSGTTLIIKNKSNQNVSDKDDSLAIASRIEKIRKLRQSEGELDLPDKKQLLEYLNENGDPDIQQLPRIGVNSFLSVHLENDIFSNRDWYYTNGVRIEYTGSRIAKSPISYILLPYKKGSINFYGISFGQNIFTPLDPDNEQIPYGDRPFSAYMYFGQFKISNNLSTNYRQISEFNLGIIGPASLGGFFLRSVHQSPKGGWDYQVNNDIIINYHARFEKTLLNSRFINIDGGLEANLGTLYTNLGGGATVKAGLFNKKVFNVTSPDTWNQLYPISGKFQFFIYYNLEGRLVGYDATLQGGLFNNSVYSLQSDQINRTIFDQRLGIVASINKLSIKVVQVWLSPEFNGGLSHKWMEVSFSVNL